MRQFILALAAASLIASQAFAQTPGTAPAQQGLSQADIAAQLQKLTGNKNSQQALGQVMVVGTILGCTQKAVGKPATDAYYQQMQQVGKQAEAYCKAKQPAQARELLLTTFAAKKNDPVQIAALGCYDTNVSMVQSVGGPKIAGDAAQYAAWIRDPEKAKTEMKDSDICR